MFWNSRFFIIILAVILLVSLFSFPMITHANDWLITPQPASVNADTEFCVGSVVPAGGVPAGYKVEWEFASGFDLTDLTISNTSALSEVVVYTGTNSCSGGTARITEATPTPANDRDAAVVSGQKITVTLEDALTGSTAFSFKFRTQAVTSVVTPITAGNYILIVRVFDASDNLVLTDADLIYVGDASQVNISANVDPILTLTLSDTACSLGTFSVTGLKTCSYDAEVSTNGTFGYTAYIKADGTLRNATDNITNVADATVGVTNSGGISTEEEYGVSTTNADATIVENDSGETCVDLSSQLITAMPASALSTSDQSFATASAPVSADSTTLCHAVVITGTTPAGSYAQTVVITVVGNF